MAANKDLVEEAIIQMKNVEQAIAENAKGILHSTMKEEISQLVKESLNEQDDEEMDMTSVDDVEMDDTEGDDMEDYDSMEDEGDDLEDSDEEELDDIEFDDEEPIDLTDASDEEILRVFKAMGEDDGIIVKKDGEDIHLSDNDADVEYLVKLGESYEDENEGMMYEVDDEDLDESIDDIIDSIFSGGDTSKIDSSDLEDISDEDVVYEIEFEDDNQELDEDYDEELDEDYDEELDEDYDEELDEDYDEELDESYNPKKSKKTTVKPKGVGIGKGPKFSYKTQQGGFKEDKKEAPKSIGTGKPKFSFDKSAENVEGKNKVVKKSETKEAARTLGNGKYFRKGGLPKPKAHSEFNANIVESLENEVGMLRTKNEEYRKALNIFREKLNEVAVFNSNLAYATRLFTEHSTTKKEKINILRRFDNVENLKESKNLYRSIKDELSKTNTQSINENVEMKLNKTVSSGASTTLIESTTYENPQFLRMKDLMSKLK